MKKYVSILASAMLAVLALSCAKKEAEVAKAVLGDVSIMNFTATDPQAQTLTVVSDGPWQATAPEWITVTPSSGNGETVVTVAALENKDAEGLLEPRSGKVYLAGNTIASRHTIIVSQEGDAYRSADHLTVSAIAGLADGKSFVLDEATVAAITGTGFVITDGAMNLYVKSQQSVQLGDLVTMKGLKGTENGVPMVNTVDACSVNAGGTMEYPTPIDLNTQIASYTATGTDYVQVSGLVSAGSLVVVVDEIEYAVKLIDPAEGASFTGMNGHNVTVKGYSYGLLGAKMLGVLATEVKDDGVAEVIYFQDDFEWLEPWTKTGVGDDVTANTVNTDTAPNVFANASAFAEMITEFQSRGYGYIWGWKGQDWSDGAPDNGNKQTLYLQKNYLKFGKTSYNSGLVLPALKAIEGSDDVFVTFDWCYCMTGGNKPDLTTLTLTIVSGDGVFESTDAAQSEEIVSGQTVKEDGTTSLAWQTVSVKVKGASSNTVIAIHPTNTDPMVTNSARKQNRWYLDNIKVVPASGTPQPLKPGTTVFDEDFEWLAEWDTYTVDDVANNSVGSAPNVFTKAEVAGALVKFQELGYGLIWGWKDQDWSDGTPDNGNKQTLYLMKNYLKFGKSDYNSGLILPAISALTTATDLELTFDWCWCMTGKAKPDLMTLTVEADGETTELTSSQPTAEDKTKLEWQHATVTITGATAETRIILRPTNTDPYISNKDRGQNRWYLDNIHIVTK